MEKSNTFDKTPDKPRISIVVALGNNRAIGKNNELLWRIPDDLKRFKILTLNHPIIMGRKTFESILQILKKPLPQRTSIVVTRDPKWSYPGVITVHSLEEALRKARVLTRREVFIAGGAQIYTQALPLVDRLYLTLIDDQKEGDAYFPQYEKDFTKVISDESRDYNGLTYRWLTLERS